MTPISSIKVALITGCLFVCGCGDNEVRSPTQQRPINHEPFAPGDPSPPNQIDSLSIETNLAWLGSDSDNDMLWFDVYFGADSTPPQISAHQSRIYFNLVQLAYHTTYYWQVKAVDERGGSSIGPIWSFTTGDSLHDLQPPNIPINLYPPDSSRHRWLDDALGWACEDIDDDTIHFDVYFGQASPPTLQARNLTEPIYHLTDLEIRTTYHWRVVARDDAGHTATGPIWSFTTGLGDSIGNLAGDRRIFPLGNSGLYYEMVWVPQGSFQMGSPLTDHDSNNDERPVHGVNFTRGFWIGRYEMTVRQNDASLGSQSILADDRTQGSMSWSRAQNLEAALGDRFRLPSEAEWEYSCRAGTTGRTYWFDNERYDHAGQYAWYLANSDSTWHLPGLKLPNPWGIYDMSGSLWEWCEDWYFASYNGAPSDGSARTEPARQNRILRGGGYLSAPLHLRSARRFQDYPAHARVDAGVRLVRQ